MAGPKGKVAAPPLRRRLSLYLDGWLAMQLRVAAIRQGKSASRVVGELVMDWLHKQGVAQAKEEVAKR